METIMATSDMTPQKATDRAVKPDRPTDLFEAMRDEMNRMFGRLEVGFGGWPSLMRSSGKDLVVPEMDLKESSNAVTISVDLPGVAEKDVTLTLSDGILTIKGEKRHEREETKENYHLSERSFGTFERSVRLPKSVDEAKVEATFDKGVLRVVAAKRPEAAKAERTIAIRAS
jgi:HSP20 family protein